MRLLCLHLIVLLLLGQHDRDCEDGEDGEDGDDGGDGEDGEDGGGGEDGQDGQDGQDEKTILQFHIRSSTPIFDHISYAW